MYGYIYKTTNLTNDKIYIGQHKCASLDNSYFGSGILILEALSKYGKENFTCEVIEWCETLEEMNEKEKYYIAKYNSRCRDVGYNLAEGGNSLHNDYHIGMLGKHQSDFQKNQVSSALLGKHLSNKTRENMSISAKARTLNKRTINDKVWVTNGVENKVVDKCDVEIYLKNGYHKGITRDYTKTREKYAHSTYVCKDGKDILVDNSQVENYLSDGYKLGRTKYSKERCNNISAGKRGKICVNDGVKEKQIDKKDLDVYIQLGFSRGHLKK